MTLEISNGNAVLHARVPPPTLTALLQRYELSTAAGVPAAIRMLRKPTCTAGRGGGGAGPKHVGHFVEQPVQQNTPLQVGFETQPKYHRSKR